MDKSKGGRQVKPVNDPRMREKLTESNIDAVDKFCDEDQKDRGLIFFDPSGHNMIIKLTHAKDFIEYPLNVDE